MNMMTRLPPAPTPPEIAAFSAMIALANRPTIEAAIEAMLAELDGRDGDPDVEDNGDDEPDGIGHGDPAWIEWTARGRHKLERGQSENMTRGTGGVTICEDVEDDDPAEDADEAEDADSDRCSAGDDQMIAGPVQNLDWWARSRNDDWWETEDNEPQFVPADMHAVPAANDA